MVSVGSTVLGTPRELIGGERVPIEGSEADEMSPPSSRLPKSLLRLEPAPVVPKIAFLLLALVGETQKK